MNQEASVVEVLTSARDHIIKVGLNKDGNYYAGEERIDEPIPDFAPCCTFGAVFWACGASPSHGIRGLPERAASVIRETFRSLHPMDLATTWNDRDGTTVDDVVALFNAAIERAS